MINGVRDQFVGENVFGIHTSRIGSIHTVLMGIVSKLEIERANLLSPYDFEEDMLPKNELIALSILDNLLSEIRNCMVGLELYGKIKNKKGETEDE